AALTEVLQKVYGLSLNLRFERTERAPLVPPAAPTRSSVPTTVKEEPVASSSPESEAEYVDEGALPLPDGPVTINKRPRLALELLIKPASHDEYRTRKGGNAFPDA
ncbi:MAG: hypothetical protein ACE5E3_06640, partial [Mariprofundus sp.]